MTIELQYKKWMKENPIAIFNFEQWKVEIYQKLLYKIIMKVNNDFKKENSDK